MSSFKWYYNRVRAYIGRPRLLVQEKYVTIDGGDYCDRPLFLIGAHRSGTSLVRRMVNSHPDIACPPESFFIEYYAGMYADEKVRAGYEGLGYDREHCRMDLMRRASSLHEAFRIGQGKVIWADKTPEYTRCLDKIDSLYGMNVRYLLIYRHPWDIANSVWKRGWRFNDIEDGFDSALIYTRDTIARMRAFETALPGRTARVVYSRLCADPEIVLRSALEKLDLSFHPDMLDFGSRNHNWGLEDPVIRGKKSIEISAGAWSSWSKAEKARATELLNPADYADIL